MKKVLIILSIVLLLCSCNNSKKKEDIYKVGYSSNLISEVDRNNLKEVLEKNNISNIDWFFNRLEDFNKEDDLGCGLKDWDLSSNFKYNDTKCMDRYEKNHSISDGNCRITSFALIEDLIEMDSFKEEAGTYLMFDMDVIENNKDYEIVKNKENEFINIFNEMDLSKVKEENYKDVFPNQLNKIGFKIKENNVSLISVVFHDSDFNLLFVGHSGILIDLGNKYLFIEKIAFEQPYQISVISSKDDLSLLFKDRSDYFGDSSAKGPFIYENDKLLYEYK